VNTEHRIISLSMMIRFNKLTTSYHDILHVIKAAAIWSLHSQSYSWRVGSMDGLRALSLTITVRVVAKKGGGIFYLLNFKIHITRLQDSGKTSGL